MYVCSCELGELAGGTPALLVPKKMLISVSNYGLQSSWLGGQAAHRHAPKAYSCFAATQHCRDSALFLGITSFGPSVAAPPPPWRISTDLAAFPQHDCHANEGPVHLWMIMPIVIIY
jgi:hypothetical protein